MLRIVSFVYVCLDDRKCLVSNRARITERENWISRPGYSTSCTRFLQFPSSFLTIPRYRVCLVHTCEMYKAHATRLDISHIVAMRIDVPLVHWTCITNRNVEHRSRLFQDRSYDQSSSTGTYSLAAVDSRAYFDSQRKGDVTVTWIGFLITVRSSRQAEFIESLKKTVVIITYMFENNVGSFVEYPLLLWILKKFISRNIRYAIFLWLTGLIKTFLIQIFFLNSWCEFRNNSERHNDVLPWALKLNSLKRKYIIFSPNNLSLNQDYNIFLVCFFLSWYETI